MAGLVSAPWWAFLIAGFLGGAGAMAVYLEQMWRSERRDLVLQIQASDPKEYVALRQASIQLDKEEKSKDKPEKPVRRPWDDDPLLTGVSVKIDKNEGLVYLETDEDTDEEDLKFFLSRYKMTVRDLN